MNDHQVQDAYATAQHAIASLKSAIRAVLAGHAPHGLRNVEVGKLLGIYQGHIGHTKHEGHISRTLLATMEEEGVVKQDPETKQWHLVQAEESSSDSSRADR